jgi:hypothetical protein
LALKRVNKREKQLNEELTSMGRERAKGVRSVEKEINREKFPVCGSFQIEDARSAA